MSTILNNFYFNINNHFFKTATLEDTVFFDIETTGFSPTSCEVYLIGCAYKKDGVWKIIQFFSDDKSNEKEIITSFLSFIEPYKLLVSFNGIGFDLKFIEEKCRLYNLNYTLNNLKQLDLYKEISPYRKFFKLEHLKQKNIESFLSISRKDNFSGNKLISIYQEFSKTLDMGLRSELLLHNHNDIVGMIQIVPIINYVSFFNGKFSISELAIDVYNDNDNKPASECIFKLRLQEKLPKRISFGSNIFYFYAVEDTAFFRIKMYEQELKYFYSDYKDYYYLPKEDISVHKSVAFFVDKDFKTKAKAANCYGKKTGRFLPQFDEIVSPYFKADYHDKTLYFELTEEFSNDTALIKKYILHIISHLLKSK